MTKELLPTWLERAVAAMEKRSPRGLFREIEVTPGFMLSGRELVTLVRRFCELRDLRIDANEALFYVIRGERERIAEGGRRDGKRGPRVDDEARRTLAAQYPRLSLLALLSKRDSLMSPRTSQAERRTKLNGVAVEWALSFSHKHRLRPPSKQFLDAEVEWLLSNRNKRRGGVRKFALLRLQSIHDLSRVQPPPEWKQIENAFHRFLADAGSSSSRYPPLAEVFARAHRPSGVS